MQQQAGIKRPRYLNLVAIRLPLPGFVSILHRVSGLLLIFALPFLIWALSAAMASPVAYSEVAELFAHPLIKLLWLGVIWSCMHHLCAGLRFLMLEMRIGIELSTTRLASVVVMVASILLTILLGWAWLL